MSEIEQELRRRLESAEDASRQQLSFIAELEGAIELLHEDVACYKRKLQEHGIPFPKGWADIPGVMPSRSVV